MGLGSLLLHDTIMNSEYPIYIGQLFSSGAISILKKMDLCIFGKPLYNKNKRMRSVLVAKGYVGIRLSIGCALGDFKLRILDLPNKIRLLILKRKFTIKRENIVPNWVEEITLHDGHRYMEVHDRDWLQWNLDHVFSKNPADKNFFYAVYDKTGKPVGFYMTKERFEENKKGILRNLVRGTVVEWGSNDETRLTEFDLNILAFSSFGRHVDKINTVISSENSKQIMTKLGFEYRGMYQMILKKTPDYDSAIQDQENWRIRYGGCNTVLV